MRRPIAALYQAPLPNRLSEINHAFITAIGRALEIDDAHHMVVRVSPGRGAQRTARRPLRQSRRNRVPVRAGGRGYIDHEAFAAAGVSVTFADYSGYPEYEQPHPPFESRGLGARPALLHRTPRARLHEGRLPEAHLRMNEPLALSIVTSMYASARFLPEFHARCTRRGPDADRGLRDRARQRRLARRLAARRARSARARPARARSSISRATSATTRRS